MWRGMVGEQGRRPNSSCNSPAHWLELADLELLTHSAMAPTQAMGCQAVKVASWILGPLEGLGKLPLALCSYPSILWKQQGQIPCPAISWSPKSANKMSYVWPSVIWAGTSPWQIAAEYPQGYWRSSRYSRSTKHRTERQGLGATRVGSRWWLLPSPFT